MKVESIKWPLLDCSPSPWKPSGIPTINSQIAIIKDPMKPSLARALMNSEAKWKFSTKRDRNN